MTGKKNWPKLYCDIYKPNTNDTFISHHLMNQSKEIDAHSGARGSVLSSKYTDQYAHVKTISDLFENGLRISRNMPCFGSRNSVNEAYEWMHYDEADRRIRAFGSALLNTVGRREGVDNIVGIYGRNSPAWVIAQHACSAYLYVYVPLYDTLGPEAMQHILNQTRLEMLVCHSAKEANCAIRNFQSAIKHVVIVQESEQADKLRSEFKDRVKIYYFYEFLKMGSKLLQPKMVSKPTDLASLCYTSGSTGVPKGVTISHEQLVSAVKSVINTLEGKFASQLTVHFCYLPLAHIMEQLLTNLILIVGAREAFMTGGPETLLADIGAVRPTVLATVPRVLMKLHSEYLKKVPKMKCMRQMLQKCIDDKNTEQSKGKFNHCSLADMMFFKKFRQLLGGQICLIVSGGAPLDTEISRFFRAALGCPLVKGYGSTETTAVLCATPLGQWENGCVGAINHGMEVKLSDVSDMGLVFSRDRIGEVCARGVCCTKGYYKDPENTKVLFDNEGWLRTGDVGMWTNKGELKLVDRCKNMFKLTQGEYIAVEKVEGVYQSCHLVLYVFVDGDATRSYSVAVVCPDMKILRDELTSMTGRRSSLINTPHPNKDTSDEELCKQKDVRKFVLSQMNTIGKERELKGFEMAKSIHLTTKPFTIENGLLTPTLKIARFRARAEFKKVIQELYEEGELV
ncbi:hypothetical protein EG68_03132 [Paragonimus skrjabini miyazakii]|uniref:long-chain-fatty-acid--CoA ligase n=1 Tax=Paragonimus skrjabini miyazakii TaxID=59628 RepID=A0A8S9Z4R6_9TREM|nr:hypothetical protein EG68_03132 [Paragonimus skrjabini miyazakii]